MSNKSHPNALPDNHQLHWYRIQQVLGQGAFGITYLALDINLDRQVAIKEYMPGQMAARLADLTIQPQSDDHKEDFQWGLTRFVEEARTLTKFEHPNLVRVLNVFELHGSAYMVMNYELGESLQQVLKREKTLDERRLIKILVPLLNGLELMHTKGFIHRDIKPGNIFIRTDGSPVLLDFGSARQTRTQADAQAMTTLVSPGYAPIEQYTTKGERQGPWTDIYGLAATLYRAILGSAPSSATDRSAMLLQGMKDDLHKLSSMMAGRYSARFLAAIDHALAFKAEQRPQSIALWRGEFSFDEAEIDTQPDVPVSMSEAVTDVIDLTHDATTQAFPATERTRTLDREASTEPVGRDVPAVKTQKIVTPAQRPEKRRLIMIAAAITVLLGLGVFLFSGDEDSGDTPEPVSNVATAADAAAPAETSESTVQDEATSTTIVDLLSLAEADMAALRLMSPKGNNAYERYNEVLALEPGNAAATEGLRALSQRYVDLAYGALAKDKTDDAAGYVLRAERIEPQSPGVAAVREAVRKKLANARLKAEAAAKAEAPAKVKKKRPAKKKKNQADTESTEDRIKKALGGT